MLTFNNYSEGQSATIYSHTTNKEWADLCVELSNDRLYQVYFHYIDYSDFYPSESDLLSALAKAQGLKSVWLKGSSFSFKDSEETYPVKGLGRLIYELQACPNLEELLIRNYSSDELDEIWKEIVNLIENKPKFKKITFEHVNIDTNNFKLFCDMLAKPNICIELDFQDHVTFSEENKILLKQALDANKSIKVSSYLASLFQGLSAKKELTNNKLLESTNSHPLIKEEANVGMLVLGGFIAALGISAVAVAFIVLNAATLGTAGLVVAGLGAAACLGGLGLFAYNYKSSEKVPDSDIGLVPA